MTAKPDERVKDIISVMRELVDDTTIPKNIKLKIEQIIAILSEDVEKNIKINRALHELDEISDDTNIQPYTRTQLYNIVSLLEKV